MIADTEKVSNNASSDGIPQFDSSKLPAYIQLLNALLHVSNTNVLIPSLWCVSFIGMMVFLNLVMFQT